MDDNDKKKPDEIRLQQDEAANLVREKLHRIYGGDPARIDVDALVSKPKEPSAKEEIKEVKEIARTFRPMSKHQKFIQRLMKAKLNMAEIQTEWHKYYQSLPADEKHEVWNEFYNEHKRRREQAKADAAGRAEAKKASAITAPQPQIQNLGKARQTSRPDPKPKTGSSKANAIKDELLKRVSSRAKKSGKKSIWHSVLFGLVTGFLTITILLFSFFNEKFITPFIRPSHNVGATPIIVDPNEVGNVGPEPKIIIPKINVEAAVVFDEPSIDEDAVQKALERGVVHYGITPNPGENGNSVIFGHSSSNILNSGQYKFAFLLLKSLEKDDIFYVQKGGKRYVYKVYNKFITSPNDTSVLDPPKDRKAITTLITCDPPGFSTNRLIVQAEQIFPDPAKNTKSSVDPGQSIEPSKLPSDSPTLWSRITNLFH